MTFVSCATQDISQPNAKCENGIFVGTYEDEAFVFKGIPFAKPPVGNLRWKAPQAPEKSSAVFEAKTFGKSCIQSPAASELASMNPAGIGEDCLTLNIWTKDMKGKKPVLFYIHGGAYGWGGTSDPLYDGSFIVNEHPDVVVVTCNYRIGLMGYADFSEIPGGEEFKDAGYLGVLDLIQGLKWVKKNIAEFGGDPRNVTIFGESAGGGMVSILMTVKEAEGLFKRAIAQSGCLNFTYTKEDFKRRGQMDALFKKTGAKTMADLMTIPENELIALYLEADESGKCLADIHNLPLRGNGSIIPDDPYRAILNGAGKNIDLIIGTTKDETRYFIDDVFDPPLAELSGRELEETKKLKFRTFEKYAADAKSEVMISKLSENEKKNVDEFFRLYSNLDNLWMKIEFMNEYAFRLPAVEFATNHARANGRGRTYMYFFEKECTNNEWIKACHASEVAYVFHNTEDTQFSGTVVPVLADKMCDAWTNFAKTGNPSSESMLWTEYNDKTRTTLVIKNDCSSELINDPRKTERELLDCVVKYYVPM